MFPPEFSKSTFPFHTDIHWKKKKQENLQWFGDLLYMNQNTSTWHKTLEKGCESFGRLKSQMFEELRCRDWGYIKRHLGRHRTNTYLFWVIFCSRPGSAGLSQCCRKFGHYEDRNKKHRNYVLNSFISMIYF